jgi:hypothetical protein
MRRTPLLQLLRRFRPLGGAALALAFSGCAFLHHVQIGDIDSRKGKLVPFDIKLSETGFNLDEAANVASSLTRSSAAQDDIAGVRALLGLFQWGPTTGNPVFTEKYAESLAALLYERCPSGRVTGLMAIREMRKYPVVSGEIVKLTGYCVK